VDTYIPPVLLTRDQYARIDGVLASELSAKEKGDEGRRLLRDGQADSLRDNLRGIASYVSDTFFKGSAQDTAAQAALKEIFTWVAAVDSGLFQAKRSDELSNETAAAISADLSKLLRAIDLLVSLVPDDILERGRAVAAATAVLQVTGAAQGDEVVVPTMKLSVDASFF
jgi:hypothetical protein